MKRDYLNWIILACTLVVIIVIVIGMLGSRETPPEPSNITLDLNFTELILGWDRLNKSWLTVPRILSDDETKVPNITW